ncbi:uncharacterized protein RJT20DRAFT_129408 [Scheffersomyces xylosifermentans]|uniref:uncharacterized protein n=1 Tax=Scheffersomyces xylosifermentans TaxID=1304137 RepID=UPI00315CA3C1
MNVDSLSFWFCLGHASATYRSTAGILVAIFYGITYYNSSSKIPQIPVLTRNVEVTKKMHGILSFLPLIYSFNFQLKPYLLSHELLTYAHRNSYNSPLQFSLLS